MKQTGKRICSLLLAAILLLGIFPGAMPKAYAAMPSGNDATVQKVIIEAITDGSAPWDDDDGDGNDSSPNNKIVRSFDSLTYNFKVELASVDSTKSYTDVYVRMEFTLPLSKAQAEFDTAAMGWMEKTGTYAYQLTDNGDSQTLVCYKHREDNGKPVVPGNFGENLSIKVKGMANGSTIAPIIKASVEGNEESKKFSITPSAVEVSAAPKFNIKIGGRADYKDNFDFNHGNADGNQIAPNLGISRTLVPGRMMNLAVCLELYNDRPDKGFKGLELPNGAPITFQLQLGSDYTINTPKDGSDYTSGQSIDAAASGYMPLLYSVDGNETQDYGTPNGDGRILYSTHGAVVNHAPYNTGGGRNRCYNGGTWTAEQVKDETGKVTNVIKVTVFGYQIDVDQMPVIDGDNSSHANEYGRDKGIGVFSAGEFWIVQPFNTLNSENPGDDGNYDIVATYGEGAFTTSATATDLKITTVGDTVFQDSEGTSNRQQVQTDDRQEYGLELVLPGGLQNRVFYADKVYTYDYGVNVNNQRDGADVATPGTKFYLRSGFSYNAMNEEGNRLYWGTNLVRFTSGVFILDEEDVRIDLSGGSQDCGVQLTTYYAAKSDGTGWVDYEEMKKTTEEDLLFYPTLAELKASGKECVAILHCFTGPGPLMGSTPYYLARVGAQVREDVTPNDTAIVISTSRVWTKNMWAAAGNPAIPTLKNGGSFPVELLEKNTYVDKYGHTCHLNSGNVEYSTYYVPASYDEANNLTPHNSDWGHWGDTMLFIGYKTGVTMTELQKVNSQEKETYALDKSQREVDFAIQPRANFDKNSGDGTLEKTTDLTITLILPKYMTYIEGSSFQGGVYTQNSADGGVRGTVTGGTPISPTSPEPVRDKDGNLTGETRLTWTLQNVTVGQALEPIYYSAFIGSKSPENDCPQGTIPLAPTVTISGTEDRRAFTADNGNQATQGITVIKGSASAFTKYVKADKAEADGTVDYVIYSANNATTEEALYLLDTMPCDAKNGSSFTGTYHVTGWKLDTALCDASKLSVYYTEDTKYANATAATVPQEEAQKWTKANLNSDGTITDMNDKRPVAWAVIGTLESNKAVNIDLQIRLEPDFDTFVAENTVYVNTISADELVAAAAATVVRRTISGMAWSDDDGDGSKLDVVDTTDTRCAGTTFYSTADDAILWLQESVYDDLSTEDLKQVKVVMSGSPNSSQPAKLYFKAGGRDWAETYRVETAAHDVLTAEEKEFVFQMDSSAYWTGSLNELRLDPVQGTGLYINIKSITLVLADGTERFFDFCTKDAYKKCVSIGSNLSSTPIYPAVEDTILPEESVFSSSRLGTTFTAADDGHGDLYFTFREEMFHGLSTADIQAIRITASGDPATNRSMKLYYATGNRTAFSEEADQKYDLGNITWEETTYTFRMAGRPGWTGAINGLRFDPLEGANLSMTLKSIMLDLTDGTTRTFDFTTEGAWEKYLYVSHMQGSPVIAGDSAPESVVRDSVKVSLYKYNATGGTTFSTGSTKNDAILTFNKVMYQGLKTSDVASVRVVMSGSSAAGSLPELFYISDKNDFDRDRHITLWGQSLTGEMKEYVFPLTGAAGWTDNLEIKGFRLDPLQAYNASFTIRSISIELTDGSMRAFDFTEPDAYKALVSPYNLESTVSYPEVDPDDPYGAVTYSDYTPVTAYLGQSVSAKNKAAVRDHLSGSYEFRDLPSGTFMVRFESGSTDLSGFDKATNAYSVYDNQNRLVAAELRSIVLPTALEDYDSTGNDAGFYGKTVVVLNYDRKVAVDLRSYRSGAPTITLAGQVDATDWGAQLKKTDSKGREIIFAALGTDGKLHITPYDLIYSKDNPDASVFYKLSYPDGTAVIHEVTLKPADVIYYEESNDDLMTFTDGQRGKWFKVTEQYRHDVTADATDYDSNADGQYQDADTHTDDYDSRYSTNGNNLFFSAGTARMVNVTSEVKYGTLVAPYPSMQFAFFGTGFELVSMGTPYGGVINVQVYDGEIESGEKPIYTRAVNTRYGIYFGGQEDGETAPPVEGREIDRLYQGTALVKDDLTYGMYTVVCTPMYSPYFDPYEIGYFDILIDGVRILNPIGATPEYERTDFNDILTSKVSLFITEYGKTELSDKLEHGPKYEIHLAPQQSIAVSVTAQAGATLRVGAQSFTGAAGEFSVYSVQNFTDNASTKPIYAKALNIGTEMHYPVHTWDADGTQILLFKNTGTTHIALTSFEYLPGTVTELSCQPEDTNAALPLAEALLLPEDSNPSATGSLNISAASLLLSSDISINFYVPEENLEGIENPYMVCIKELYDSAGNVIGTEEKKLIAYAVKDDKRVYTFDGISAMEMGSIVTATMCGTKDGAEVRGNAVNYSVKTYATNQLARENTDAKLKTLLVDMLNYGASAQSFWNYNTTHLANADLTAEQKAFATQTEPALADCFTLSGNGAAKVKFSSASLLLKEKVAIKYYLQPNGYTGKVSDLTIKLTYADANGETQTESITGDKFTIVSDGCYAVVFDGLNASQMRTVCTAEIFDKDGTKVSGTLTYSIEAYAARKTGAENSDPKLVTLLNDMMKYGDSTCAYFGISTVPPRKARQAYELCYTDSLDNPQVLEGIESGWEIDNRAGLPKLTTTNNGTITDVMTDEHSRLLRYFNRVTEGRLDLQFKVLYIDGFNGNVLRLCDEDDSDTYYLVTKDNAFWIKTRTGELQQITEEFQQLSGCNILFRVIVDLDRQIGTTYINNQLCGTYPLTGSAIRYLSLETLDETCNTTEVYGGYIQANYAIYENFDGPTTAINCEFTNAERLSLNGEVLSLPGGVTTARSFEALSGKVSFHATALLPNGSTGSLALCAGDTTVVEITAKDGSLYANGHLLKNFTDNLWYDLRIEADMQAQRAVIKVSNQIVDTVNFLVKSNYVDGICLTNSGSVAFSLDNIMVNNLLDYDVPEPVLPAGANDYTIGINVCSLWENGSHWGWATITPHDDLKPVLGYYDEGVPETADWEIKFMVEHGIDFQAFCWFARQSNAPLTTGHTQQLDAYLNSKYGDKMKFCLLWEAANGARPENSAAFRNYYVPYWIENYFSNPNYMVIDNKPVLAIFGTNKLMDSFGTGLKDEFDYLRQEVKDKLGYDGVIILDCNGGRNNLAAYGFDGWYAYNWGTNGNSLETNKYANLNAKKTRDVYTVPTISVGFNDVGWHQTRHPMMTVSDYKEANQWVRDEYLPNRGESAPSWSNGFVMLSTWNEYGEGTYLMPAEGLNGFGYLDVIREVYTKGGSHTDITPTEEQLARITHNYPQDRRVLRRNGNYVFPESSNKRVYDFTQADAYQTYLDRSCLSDDVTVSTGGTTFTTLPTDQSNDAKLFFKSAMFEGLTADKVTRIRVVASGIPVGQSMQLFFNTNNTGYFEANSITVPSTTTEETTFLFDVGLSSGWTGTITGLRLDPLQVNNTSFTIKSIAFELAQEYPELYINGIQMKHTIYPETHDNVDYFPFEPGVSLIQYQLYTYHEWDYATSTLTLYSNHNTYTFTVGKDYAQVNGQEQVPLGGAVILQDGVPMLPIRGLAQALGLHCVQNGKDYYITTAEQSLYDYVEGVWKFDRRGACKGWNASGANISFGDGCLQMTALPKADGTYDPMLSVKNLDLDCSEYKTLEIKCKWSLTDAAGGTLGFYFTTNSQTSLSESKRVKCSIQPDSDGYQILRFDMTENAYWTGTLTQLRFDPFDCAGTIDIAYIRFVEAKEEEVLLREDAESGENAFFSWNADLSIVEDPEARYNQCYHVTGEPNNWLYMRKYVTFTPGTTYRIDFDVKLDPDGKNESSEVLCNMRYMDADGKKDHIVKNLSVSKSDGWLHYSATYTVPTSSTDRRYDEFTIYSNPKGNNNEKETAYYVDNVKVVVVDEGTSLRSMQSPTTPSGRSASAIRYRICQNGLF